MPEEAFESRMNGLQETKRASLVKDTGHSILYGVLIIWQVSWQLLLKLPQENTLLNMM